MGLLVASNAVPNLCKRGGMCSFICPKGRHVFVSWKMSMWQASMSTPRVLFVVYTSGGKVEVGGLGDRSPPVGSRGEAPVGGLEKLKCFCYI